MQDYEGLKVKVKNRGEGIIVGKSQRYNGTWVVLIDGENVEIHDQYVTYNGKTLPIVP